MNTLSFDIECLVCSKKLHCPMSAVGKKVKCPKCGAMMMAEPLQNDKGVVPVPKVQPKAEPNQTDNTDQSESDTQQDSDPIVLHKSNANKWMAIAVFAILLLVLAGAFLLMKGQSNLAANVETKVQPTKADPPVEPAKAPEPKDNEVQDKFRQLKARGVQAEETTPPADKPVNEDAITAMALWTEYEANFQAAENKYGNKFVKVTGKVYGITRNEQGATTISFAFGPLAGGDYVPSVLCDIREASKSDFSEVKKGMEITVICKPLEMKDMEAAHKGLAVFCVDGTLVK